MSCDSALNFALLGTTCVCDSGFAMAPDHTCVPCTNTLDGCLVCTDQSTCTSCDLGDNFIVDPSNPSACICNPGFYLSSGSCSPCPTTGIMVACLACSGASTCTQCDTSLFYQLSGTQCTCISGYYQSASACLSCSTMVGCLTCTDGTTCTACDTT